ncbi:MAG: OmpA family protein [Oligoflexus sp.]
MSLEYRKKLISLSKSAIFLLGFMIGSCTSSDDSQQIEEFTMPSPDESASEFDQDNTTTSSDGVEDYTISDYQSFDPTGIHIPFEFDKASLTPQGIAALDRIIQGMTDDPLARLTIRGHADKQGKEEYNEDLSARRAKVIEEYLINNGIDPERLQSVYLGVREPVVDEERVSAYKKNRRGDFHINYGPSVFGP